MLGPLAAESCEVLPPQEEHSVTESSEPDILAVGGPAHDASPREAAAMHAASASETRSGLEESPSDYEGWFIPPVVIPLVILVAVLAGWYVRVSG